MAGTNDNNLLDTTSNEKSNVQYDITAEESAPSLEKSTNKQLDIEELPSVEADEGREPTDHEMSTLRHVSSSIPLSCWLVAIVELAERFAFYGLSAPFQNYMQRTQTESPRGMLGLGQQGATALSYFFQFWCYVTPIFGGWLADTYLGKFKAISIFSGVYVVGIFLLFITSIPSITTPKIALGGFVTSLIIIGIATGGVKANVSPLIADQVPKTKPFIKVTKKGERVIVDPNVTIQRVFMFFYMMINIGSLSVIATAQLELHVGFWAAYLLPFCFFFFAIAALILGRNQYVKTPVGDKIINKSFACAWVGIKNRFSLDAAKPSLNPDKDFRWDDHFVEEVRRATYACGVFVFYPIFWTIYSSINNNQISVAANMELHGLSNSLMTSFNSIAIIVFIPIVDKFFYPFMRRFTPMKPISRISIGFFFSSAAMVYSAVLQHFIYKAGPCYDQPRACAPEFADVPNRIHIAIQVPVYVLVALSEIFASITGLEYAYSKSPSSMKSFTTSIFLLTYAGGALIGMALSSTAKDPIIIWNFTGLGVAAFVAGVAFYLIFRKYNKLETQQQSLDYKDDVDLQPVSSYAHSAKGV
ncbi:Peptide transporter PTR2 [Candida viswanathii]|uniref:Peptide transporter PTR2 n=1 Tax=Candida viswanathii TaxID=5486 RepID=A0A367YMW9_9ASCO|nr:Peptide transporter PTR2 [Candida viswanathii]